MLNGILDKGYVRIQAIIPQYLFIQHKQSQLKSVQSNLLWDFFVDKKQEIINYGRVVVERTNQDLDWKKGKEITNSSDYIRLYEFTKTGEIEPKEEGKEIGPETHGNLLWLSHPNRMRDIQMVPAFYRDRPGVNPLGDHFSFATWLNNEILD